MYHHVENVPEGGSLYVLPARFEEQMKFLRDNGYSVISLAALADIIDIGAKIPRNTVVVTFDDGNANNYINAFPILKKYRIPATIFLISDAIGKGGYLNYRQIKEMSKEGIEFGSHTKTHRNLKEATEKEMAREVAISKALIESITGKPADTFCYPNGEKNDHGAQVLREAGFKAACVNMPRDGSVRPDVYLLKRIKVTNGPVNTVFRLKLSGYYTFFKVHNGKRKDK